MTQPRVVRFALCLPDGTPLGLTSTVEVDAHTYWPEAQPLQDAAERAWGIRPVILRLASVTSSRSAESVLYTATVDAPPSITLQDADPLLFAEEPLRMRWATPAGLAADLAWADAELGSLGRTIRRRTQVRTWNLSSLWRLTTDRGDVWLKSVPSFFAHEPLVLARLQRHSVPRLLAGAPGLSLLADVDGEDLYEPDTPSAMAMVDLLIGIQHTVDLDAELRGALPRWTPTGIGSASERLLDLYGGALGDGERRAVAGLLSRLDRIEDDLDACGIPETLVHGDFHPGNLRGTKSAMTLLDWGDSGIGHPLLDHAAFVERMPAETAEAVTARWLAAWSRAVPGSDPKRALDLLVPVGMLRQATLYQKFLDRIEPAEWVYHAADPLQWLQKVAAAV